MSSNYLTKDQYKLLGKECDKVLLSEQACDYVVAINFLHVTREDQTLLKRYQRIFHESIWFFDLLSRYNNFFKFSLFAIYNLTRSLFHRNVELNLKKKSVDFLFISHYTGKSEFDSKDPYFGDVISQLNNKTSIVTAFINHTNRTDIDLKNRNVKITVLPLSNFSNFYHMLCMYKNLFLNSFSIRQSSNSGILSKIIKQTRVEALSYSTVRNLIIANQIKDIVDTYSPSCIVTTYEGHAWERLAFSAARSAKFNIKCIAYQHAPIFRLQHAIRRPIGEQYNPDIILTSGTVSKNQLELSNKLCKTKIITLGSGRNIKLKMAYLSQKYKTFSCLVAPEGKMEECNIIFNFSLKCAIKNPTMIFIWRFPPMVNIKLLIKHNNIFLNLPNNIIVSRITLLKDILRSRFILYRGSSVVIQSVVFGLKPIYLKIYDELTIDPLYAITQGRDIICNVEEFEKSISTNVDATIKKNLITYCKYIYTPLDVNILENVLKNYNAPTN